MALERAAIQEVIQKNIFCEKKNERSNFHKEKEKNKNNKNFQNKGKNKDIVKAKRKFQKRIKKRGFHLKKSAGNVANKDIFGQNVFL